MRTTAPDPVRRAPHAAHLQKALAALALSALFQAASCVPGKGTIGAVISQDDASGRLILREVPPDLAAARADLKPGDEILTIDGQDVRPMDAKQINTALTGDVDSTVKLTLLRGEQVVRVTLKRTEAQKLARRPAKVAGSP